MLLVYRSREYLLKCSLTLRLFMDFLARHKCRPLTARQIVAHMNADTFYINHGANARATVNMKRKIRHAAVKVYVGRFRDALQAAFSEAGLNLDPSRVLVSERTDSSETLYRLRARIEWFHTG